MKSINTHDSVTSQVLDILASCTMALIREMLILVKIAVIQRNEINGRCKEYFSVSRYILRKSVVLILADIGFLNLSSRFSTNVPLLYPLKTSENQRFSDVFRGYRSGTLIENELNFGYVSTSTTYISKDEIAISS